MTDTDSDVPDLVESSDDDNPSPAADQAERWLRKKAEFLERQELWNRVFCLGPFLFGVNNIIAAAWIKALSNAKLILKESRQFHITFLEWQEWECVDLIDHAIQVVHKNLRNKHTLSKVIELVHRLEECRSGVVIDIDLAIEEAKKVSQIADIWKIVLNNQLSRGKEKAAKFAVLYIVKIYREHVLHFDDESGDFVDTTKKNVKSYNNKSQAESFKKTGNELFAVKEYSQAEEYYTKAATHDPFCHIYYGNRAQSYHKLDRYKEALADGRRAITIKPDFAKGHYRYAKAFHQLGQLESAIRVIKLGLELCQPAINIDFTNVKQLEELLSQYHTEKTRNKAPLNPIPKELEDKLSTLSVEDSDCDLTDKFNIKVPPPKVHSGDLSIFNDTSDNHRRDSSKDKSSSSNKGTEKEKKKMKRKDEEMKKKKSEEEKKKKEHEDTALESNSSPIEKPSKKELEEKEKSEFESYLKEGWESIKEDMPKIAMLKYRKALDMISNEDKMKLFGLDDIDFVTLKYAHGISAVKTGLYKNINEAAEKFQDIIDNHQDVRFPLAYFGLGKAYIALFRFTDALEPLEAGRKIAHNITFVQVTWPGTNHKIRENDSNELLSQIKDLIQLCRIPPLPEAVCRHHTDTADNRTAIYLNDPGFKGCIKIICQMDCVIPFHMTCWKTYKQNLHKVGDKDVLDSLCPTPDCAGFIVKVEVTRHDSISKEHISTKYTALKDMNKGKKPSVKQKSTSETKLVKKQEKKEIRKMKKKQRHEGGSDLVDNDDSKNSNDGSVITDGASAMAFIEEILTETQPLPPFKDSTVLKKDDPDSQKNPPSNSKSKRNRKKKEKTKQILNVAVNFSDRKEETLLNENSVVSDEETPTSKGQTPFSVPSELKSQINTFEKTYQGSSKPLFQPDEVTENLFSYFSDFLQANGPLPVDDIKVQQELEVFPPEALDKIKQVGGLCDFLKQSFKFAVIDDVISLLSEAKRAREIALLRRSERQSNSAPVIVPVNAWTTVGKSTNNVDSLKESTVIQASLGYPHGPTSKPLLSQPPAMPSSSSSSSLVSVGSDSPNLSQNTKALPNGLSEPNTSNDKRTETNKKIGIDNLDSIDDFPTLHSGISKKKDLEVVKDLDTVSDVDSDRGGSYTKTGPIKGSRDDLVEITLSRSSSHSDLSEKSSRSDYSADSRPKPLRPLGVEKIGLGRKVLSSGINWDKMESDFDSSWNKVQKEEFENGADSSPDFGSVGLELKQATEDFVRKSDEKFVAELAESVVDKLFQGKTISETERQNTLNKVSSDIWKDFEKSANAGKFRGPGLWADTPAGQDYSNNLGKFASDFMNKHYDGTFSPTSTLSAPFPPVVASSESVLYPSSSAVSSTWVSNDTAPKTSFNSPFSVSSSTGYNLFSGPTWGFDAFNSNGPTSPSMQRIIRPPNSATGFYQRGQAPVNPAPGGYRPPGFAPQFIPNVRMPPPHPSPYPLPKIDRKEIETQTLCNTKTVSVMTDTYEPFKDEYMKLKADTNEIVKMMNNSKDAYEKMVLDLQLKDKALKDLESSIVNKDSVYDYEKKNWVNEKKAYSDKIRELQLQLESKDKAEKELKDRMQGQEKKVNELAVLANDQRTKDLGEIKKLLEKAEKCQQEIETQTKRATAAEVELLKTKLATAKGFLERSQKEAGYHNQHLSAQVSKLRDESKPIPPALQQTLDYWKMVLQKSEENLNKLKTEADVQLNEIKNGKVLSELRPWSVDNPPPMPETVKGYMMEAMMQRSQQARPQSGAGAAGKGPLGTTSTSLSLTAASPGPQNPPKPLTPISSAPGLIPPRPLSSLRSAVSLPSQPAPLRPLRMQQPLTSFEKLMQKLHATFPNYSRQEFNTLIQELRQEKGGSLSGMTMEDIVSKIGEKVGRARTKSPHTQYPTQRSLGPPPGLNKSWAFTASSIGEPSSTGGQHRIEMFQEEEDPCVICHEEMTSSPSVTLECHHTFHDECIRKWFQEQSTCPNCRVHTLLSDEFPSLNG